MDKREILRWLQAADAAPLYAEADRVRREHVGDAVHLRGLIEISNYCVRQCGYCGLRAGNRAVERYRMNAEEILRTAYVARGLSYGTVVMQSGEDDGITAPWMAMLISRIKHETGLAVTLSLGERSEDELALWRAAGADRYLLRFETSDPELYRAIHPPRPGRISDRVGLLRTLRRLGYEAGSGVMIGLPGQSWESLADDLLLFRELDLDMIGVGPYIAHPATPLASAAAGEVPATEEMVYRVVALARLLCPQANIPSTTALATLNPLNGRELGLERGANVVMPNLTPTAYRRHYQIYPNKVCLTEKPSDCAGCLRERIRGIGRLVGQGPGGRLHA